MMRTMQESVARATAVAQASAWKFVRDHLEGTEAWTVKTVKTGLLIRAQWRQYGIAVYQDLSSSNQVRYDV